MTDIRQSPMFAHFMSDLGWKVERIKNNYVYLRKFPFIGFFTKIPRPHIQLTQKDFAILRKKYHLFKLNISPLWEIKHPEGGRKDSFQVKEGFYKKFLLDYGFKINHFPFNPTTTIHIDLTRPAKKIFSSFSSAKRRAVRRAVKLGIIVKESSDLNAFIKIRKRQYFPTGFLIVNEMKMLWQNFYPQNASLLLAYASKTPGRWPKDSFQVKEAVAGILLLFYDKIAYYWYASSLSEGKKLFAPTLLVWEALKSAKKRGCSMFDFEGIYDERFPKASESWKGFTKFKEGFGGKKVVYMENFSI